MCYHVKFGSIAAMHVHINRNELPKIGERWDPAVWGGDVTDDLKTSPLSICVTMSKLVILRQRVYG